MRVLSLLSLALLASACSFHSTATHWNGLRDIDGKPIFVKSTTNIGFNLLIILPLFGNTTLDAMIDETTAEIAEQGGNRVRVIQSGSENYWYGWSPFTWILSPVVTDVSLEYEPSQMEMDKVMAEEKDFNERQAVRRRQDNSHVVPAEPPRR